MPDPVSIELKGVHYRYPSKTEALTGVDLRIASGEKVAIIGQNGAGKTTLARHFNGILKPTAGHVRVGGLATTDYSVAHLARQVAYLFQNPDEQLFARTVLDDVAFGPRNLGANTSEARQRAQTALRRVGLEEAAGVRPHQLLLGERKLVALAGVLAMQSPVVVLDEPTTGQDARGTALVADILRELHDSGRSVVVITHDMDFCVETFERVLVVAGGAVVADGSPAEVFSNTSLIETAGLQLPQLMRLAKGLRLATQFPQDVAHFLDAYESGL